MKPLGAAALFLASIASANSQNYGPPKEVKDLGWMVGTWAASGKIAFGGHEATITSTMRVSFDGQFLRAVSIDKSAGSTLTKTTMTGWEPKENRYVSYSFTNMAPTARIAHGTLEGGKLQMVSDPWEAEGVTLVGRETTWKISDTQCDVLLEYKSGGNWVKEMDFVFT